MDLLEVQIKLVMTSFVGKSTLHVCVSFVIWTDDVFQACN